MASTSLARPTTFSSTALDALRNRIQGRVLVSGDDRYDAARRTWNVTTFEQHPAMVVLPVKVADVVAAVAFAREHALAIAVQGGGHGHPRPADGAVLVNFADMAAVRVTPTADGRGGGTARVEAGAKWGEVIARAHTHGLAPLSGFAATVGVVGYTLGGGVGWLARQYGAAAGSVRSAEVVTSDGRLLQVNAQRHADLFWGLRGGGGNFGIVTALELELFPVKDVFGGFVAYPLAQGGEALKAYAEWTRGVPDSVTSAVRLMHYPPVPQIPEPLRGASAVVIMACCNASTAEGDALLKPLRSIGTPLVDTFRRMPYAEIGTIANDPPDAPPLLTAMDSGGLRELSSEAIDGVLRIAGDRAAGIFLVEARHLGGALARQPEASTPFAFRSPWFISALAAAPTPDALRSGKRSIDALLKALEPVVTGERLINGLDAGNSSPHRTRAGYAPETYQKLVALKDRYDPANVFRFNHNIAPSTGEPRATVGERPIVEPADVRTAVDAVIGRALSDKRIVGTVVLIARDGELVYQRAAGLADRESGTGMRLETLFRLASVTKAIVCAAAMSLVERGKLSLESRVDRWLPEFRPKLSTGETPAITIRHLLTHTAGLDYRFQQPPDGPYARANVSDGNDQPGLSGQENLRRIASAPLVRPPGVAWQYSVAIDVLGAVMEQAVAKPLPEIVAERVIRPLAMSETSFAVADVSRLAVPYVDAKPEPRRMVDGDVVPYLTGAGISFAPSRALDPASFASGGTGMIGCASDLLRFFETIRRGGRPILSEGSTAQMLRNQNASLPDDAQGPGPGWGFGFGGSVLTDPAAADSPQSPGTWQWGGVYGHSWFVDPERRLTVIALTNTALEGLAGRFPIELRDAIYRVV